MNISKIRPGSISVAPLNLGHEAKKRRSQGHAANLVTEVQRGLIRGT